MNKETNEHLEECLEEAHSTFKNIIEEMKEKNIDYDYYEEAIEEEAIFRDVSNKMEKLRNYVAEVECLHDNHIEMISDETILCVKYLSLYAVSLLFIKVFHTIFDTRDLNEMVKYGVGMFLGSTYMGLLGKDIYDNRNGTKERRDLINKLKTIREEYKTIHDDVVFNIDKIFKKNDNLWTVLDRENEKSK